MTPKNEPHKGLRAERGAPSLPSRSPTRLPIVYADVTEALWAELQQVWREDQTVNTN